MFWAVTQQFDPASGWAMAGGMEGPRCLHIALEGPNPDPRMPEHEPPDPRHFLTGRSALRYGAYASSLTIDGDAPEPEALEPTLPEPTPRRFPLYVLRLEPPDGEPLTSHGGGSSSSRGRDPESPPTIMNSQFALPSRAVTELSVTLYDDDEVVATGRLERR